MKLLDSPYIESGQGFERSRFDGQDLDAAARAAALALLREQKAGGDWEGEMVWCTMILAQTVIVRSLVDRPYDVTERLQIIKHFRGTQDAEGAWGMHPESEGYVFFTTMAYVALRFLDLPAGEPMLVKARRWLHAQPGGVRAIPSWGKFWLSLLGLYQWEGVNPIPPEIFLLPKWLPFHPSRFYCHTRQIYLGIAYLYGLRFCADLSEALRNSLREELYGEVYETIDFPSLHNVIARTDSFVPISAPLRVVYGLLGVFERWHGGKLRTKALGHCLERILYEQRSTRYQGISPVSGLLNCLALFATDPRHPDLAASIEGLEAWRWEDEQEGLRYVGARSNSWDTAFALQALTEAPLAAEEKAQAFAGALAFLDRAQMGEELPELEAFWRDSALGGWCFSDGRHNWPVSDCTAEALSALLALRESQAFGAVEPLPEARLVQAVEFILSRQNRDGGFGTYERRRGGKLLEWINPSEMYGQCMTELSYLECTASSLGALAHFRRQFPEAVPGRIDAAIGQAVAFLRASQLPDGSFPGFWGVNYTYGIFHVVKGLRLAGVGAEDPALQAAARWLVVHQRADGGWGEHYTSCLVGRYVEHSESQAVMSSWALLALMEVLDPRHPVIGRGVAWLLERQGPDGTWPRQAVNGVFFGAAMLDYRLYHLYFPAWALARHARLTASAPEGCGPKSAKPIESGPGPAA